MQNEATLYVVLTGLTYVSTYGTQASAFGSDLGYNRSSLRDWYYKQMPLQASQNKNQQEHFFIYYGRKTFANSLQT